MKTKVRYGVEYLGVGRSIPVETGHHDIGRTDYDGKRGTQVFWFKDQAEFDQYKKEVFERPVGFSAHSPIPVFEVTEEAGEPGDSYSLEEFQLMQQRAEAAEKRAEDAEGRACELGQLLAAAESEKQSASSNGGEGDPDPANTSFGDEGRSSDAGAAHETKTEAEPPQEDTKEESAETIDVDGSEKAGDIQETVSAEDIRATVAVESPIRIGELAEKLNVDKEWLKGKIRADGELELTQQGWVKVADKA